jgi:hypothetical protein
VRLNIHCDFEGHCIQMKNTFVHVQCNHGDDSESESACTVCKIARSRSCDALGRARSASEEAPLTLTRPPGLRDPDLNIDSR